MLPDALVTVAVGHVMHNYCTPILANAQYGRGKVIRSLEENTAKACNSLVLD